MAQGSGRWIQLVAATALLAAGCSTASSPPTANPTPAATLLARPTQSPTARQEALCQAPSNRCLALVTLRGSASIVVRDITDISRPKTVANLGDSVPIFVSGDELSFTNSGGLVRAPLTGTPKTVVTSRVVESFTWSPDRGTVVYTTQNDSGIEVHQLSAGKDRVIGSVPSQGAGGCETIEGCAIANSLDFRLAYSPDGTVISLVSFGFGGGTTLLWSSDGKPLKTGDITGSATMSVWSGDSLYFSGDPLLGVQRWRNGVVLGVLPGKAWIRPKASPDGRHIVYVARDGGGWAHTYVLDTITGISREIKTARAEPVFLTSRYLWYEGERACAPADGCGANPPFHPLDGKTYIYDLQQGTESTSVITSVVDVWPHAA